MTRIALALALTLLAGCMSTSEDPRWRTVHPPLPEIVVTGVHVRWFPDNTIAVSFYGTNTAGYDLKPDSRGVTAQMTVNIGYPRSGDSIGTEFLQITDEPWLSATSVPFRWHPTKPFPPNPQVILLTASPGKEYRYWCFDKAGIHDAGEVACNMTSAERAGIYTPRTEPNLYPALEACCEWQPPQIEPWDTSCSLTQAVIKCKFHAWNWSNRTAEGSANVSALALRRDGTYYSLGTVSVDLGRSFGALEEREFETAISLGPEAFANASAAKRILTNVTISMLGRPTVLSTDSITFEPVPAIERVTKTG